jgi:hypothetical protein
MPLDSTGVPAPRSLSKLIDHHFAEHRARLRKLRRRASNTAKPRRRFDEGRRLPKLKFKSWTFIPISPVHGPGTACCGRVAWSNRERVGKLGNLRFSFAT